MVDDEGLPQIRRCICTRCGECVTICPQGALEMAEDGPEVAYPDLCGGCALCEELCPEEAIDCDFAIVW